MPWCGAVGRRGLGTWLDRADIGCFSDMGEPGSSSVRNLCLVFCGGQVFVCAEQNIEVHGSGWPLTLRVQEIVQNPLWSAKRRETDYNLVYHSKRPVLTNSLAT